jgi:hypothetical protein
MRREKLYENCMIEFVLICSNGFSHTQNEQSTWQCYFRTTDQTSKEIFSKAKRSKKYSRMLKLRKKYRIIKYRKSKISKYIR